MVYIQICQSFKGQYLVVFGFTRERQVFRSQTVCHVTADNGDFRYILTSIINLN